jgi:tetratricopeptide (TPR) repeat protein
VVGGLAPAVHAPYNPLPMRPPMLLGAALVALCAVSAPVRALESVWARLPAGLPADSLAPALLRLEAASPRSTAAGAAYALGQFHHARGEYRLAADAFGRAAARLTGYERAESRYRQGLAWLGAGDGGRARAAFEEVATESQPLRPLAQLGLAQALAFGGETEREIAVLKHLLDGPAGEAEPAALERYAALCDRAHRTSDAIAARDRLLRRWPRSLEAARLGQPAVLVRP